MKASKWKHQWLVKSNSQLGEYKVSCDREDPKTAIGDRAAWGCSCPHRIFRSKFIKEGTAKECDHITEVEDLLRRGAERNHEVRPFSIEELVMDRMLGGKGPDLIEVPRSHGEADFGRRT